MAFTYDLTTDIGKVRLLISDTDATSFHFTDAEIQVFLDMASDSILIAAAFALEAWAAALTDSYTSEKIGDYSYTRKEAETKRALAIEYKNQEAESPYLDWAEWNLSGVEEEEE